MHAILLDKKVILLFHSSLADREVNVSLKSRSLNACQLSRTIQVIYSTTSCCKVDMVMQDANASAVTQQEQGSQVKHTVHALAGERIGQLIA